MKIHPLTTKSILRLALIGAATAASMVAADKPNLSGSWKMDVSKSDFGGAPPPDSLTRRIEHNEPALTLIDAQISALGKEQATRKYTTDGKETTYQWMGSEVKSAAHWEEDALVIVGKVNAGGTDLVVTSTLTLSTDGKTLTENGKVAAEGNQVAAYKVVLIKE
jgi:hypothetical protein